MPEVRCPYCGERKHLVENKRWHMENRAGKLETHIRWRCVRCSTRLFETIHDEEEVR